MSEEQLAPSDANIETSSESQESTASLESASESPSESSSKIESKPETPFHEHPRFKELINEKNQFASRYEEMSKQVKEMQARMEEFAKPKPVETKNQLIERLKGIDPEFGTWAEQQEATRAQLQEFAQWKAQLEVEKGQAQVRESVTRLHSEHKVSPELQGIYESQIKAIAQSNPSLGLKDLPALYKQVHDQFSKIFEARERSKLASYAQGKKQDAAVPPAQKGQAPKPSAPKTSYPKDREEAKSVMVKQIMNQLRNNSG